MKDLKKPLLYSRMVNNILRSLKDNEYNIIQPPNYLGFYKDYHIFFTVISDFISNGEHTIWLDYLTPNAEIKDSNCQEIDDEFKLVIKGILSKEFRTYNILHGAN